MLRLQDIMSTDLKTIDADEPAVRAYEVMRQWKLNHLLVVDGGTLVGIVSDRDLGSARGKAARESKRVFDLMTPKPFCAEGTMTVREAARKMRNRAIGALPVLKNGRLAGVITVADLLDLIGRGIERPIVRTERQTLSRRAPRTRALP